MRRPWDRFFLSTPEKGTVRESEDPSSVGWPMASGAVGVFAGDPLRVAWKVV